MLGLGSNKFLKRHFYRCYHNKVSIQYVSDIHVDFKQTIPIIAPRAPYLAVCGDVGDPFCPTFKLFFDMVSPLYCKIFFVGGNHDYLCYPIHNLENVSKCKQQINTIFESYSNVYFLDKGVHLLENNIYVIGTTLWSHPTNLNPKYSEMKIAHMEDVEWIKKTKQNYLNNKLVVLTHFVPSFKLIESKYKEYGSERTSLFATNLEHLVNKPINGWICGHTHSVLGKQINGIYCGINALGNYNNIIETKILTIE